MQRETANAVWTATGFTDTSFGCDDGTGGGKMAKRSFTRFKVEAVKLVREAIFRGDQDPQMGMPQ
jgi:hypothetical protein